MKRVKCPVCGYKAEKSGTSKINNETYIQYYYHKNIMFGGDRSGYFHSEIMTKNSNPSLRK